MMSLGIEKFDLAFIDGDHERESFLKDVQICENLLKDPKIMIIDDTKEEIHPCCHVYFDEIKMSEKYETYDFDDWNRFVGMSIVTKLG
jgi:predicted O-methyltransferase YrrM